MDMGARSAYVRTQYALEWLFMSRLVSLPNDLGVKGSQVQILSSRLERVADQGPFQSDLKRPLERFWGPVGDQRT
jgi:hypothetical protein